MSPFFGGLAISVMTIKNGRKRMSSKGLAFLVFYCWSRGLVLYVHGNCWKRKYEADRSGEEIDSVKAAYAEERESVESGKEFCEGFS